MYYLLVDRKVVYSNKDFDKVSQMQDKRMEGDILAHEDLMVLRTAEEYDKHISALVDKARPTLELFYRQKNAPTKGVCAEILRASYEMSESDAFEVLAEYDFRMKKTS